MVVVVLLVSAVVVAAFATVNLNDWLAGVPTPLDAPKVTVYVPTFPAEGVPPRTPVAALKVTPVGSVPVS